MEFVLSFVCLVLIVMTLTVVHKKTDITDSKVDGHYPTAEEARQAIKDADDMEGWG